MRSGLGSGRTPSNKVESSFLFPSSFLPLPHHQFASFTLRRVDLRVSFTMLAARNFSAARQCLRSVRVAPSLVAPVSQVPIYSPRFPSENVQLANCDSPDARFVAMLPLPMKPLPSSRVRRALMYVASQRKPFPPVSPVRAAQCAYTEIGNLPYERAVHISNSTNPAFG